MEILQFQFPAYLIRQPYAIPLPKGSHIIHVNQQGDMPTIWAVCPFTEEKETRVFHLLYTGDELPSGKQAYLGTVHIYEASLVIHIFEEQQS